jgi:hypothetical protein
MIYIKSLLDRAILEGRSRKQKENSKEKKYKWPTNDDKKCSASLTIQEIQIKTRYNFFLSN